MAAGKWTTRCKWAAVAAQQEMRRVALTPLPAAVTSTHTLRRDAEEIQENELKYEQQSGV